MKPMEIFLALQAKKISPEDATKELAKIKPVPEPPINEESIQEISYLKKEYLSVDYKEGIAIVGMSGKYPGASNIEQYWNNLVQAKNSIQEIPQSRWDVNKYYDPHLSQKDKINCKWIGLLDDIEYFDPLFFNISPTEAEVMDPQQRIFLQEGYKAFEDAGYSRQQLSNKKCGVYLGIMSNEYGLMLYQNKIGGITNTTGNSNAIAAARIPYFLNLKGPAIPIDTACSSSLVATHLACQALLNREVDMALVGGVTLYLAPELYIGMCEAGMLSPDGQCKTFDNSANGFVPGDGVGALVLKRLKDAEADQDLIYGVIIGSGINQDGKTNGITAPSVNSQIELEREIYDKYKIHPESIGYVEMHGTGTKLGDPIELEALSTVFKEKTNRKKYCAIGSVKSNIGHTSAAAGMASVQKVLLCLKHKQLVPTLNFKQHNEHFNFDDSPFYVNTELRPWEATSDIPRRAAVSSFGFSGTNAHIVIEEYFPKIDIKTPVGLVNTNNPILFVLSAKSEEQLKIYAECMKKYIKSQEDLNLLDMSYTLQVGREAMDYRLAFLAKSKDAIIITLEGFINNDSSARFLSANVKRSKDEVSLFEADDDAKALLQTWIQKRKLKKIAELWVKGLNIDWNEFYVDSKPHRISLPTYPFAREHCWVPESEAKSAGSSSASASAITASSIHPLLHQNTSDFSEQRFSSTFTGEEFFLSDHVVKGQRILPGVAYLEMARAAVEKATGALAEGRSGILLKNVVWARPIAVGEQSVQIHIGLYSKENGEIAYEIYNEPGEAESEPIMYSQGSAVLSLLVEVPILDLPALQEQCSQSTLSSTRCYEVFRSMGIDYGPAHQGIEKVYVGQGQVLAKLSLPSSISGTQEQFVLHPSMMDSALQASIGLIMVSDHTMSSGSFAPLKLALPFALQELKIFGNCTPIMWAMIRYSDGSAAEEKVQKFDIDLCDEQGRVCVRMRRFSTRVMEGEVQTGKISNSVLFETSDGPMVETSPETRQKQQLRPSVVPVKQRARTLMLEKQTPIQKPQIQAGGITQDLLREKSTGYIKKLVGETLKIPSYKIDPLEPLESYGIDSILVIQLTNTLSKVLNDISSTLFFEYQTIDALVEHFIKTQKDSLIKLTGLEDQKLDEEISDDSEVLVEPPSVRSNLSFRRSGPGRFLEFQNPEIVESGSRLSMIQDIAIIGLSGRYPGANDVNEFWNILIEGKNCITEIPKDRWNWKEYFDDEKGKAGSIYAKWGGFIEDINKFDPLFFQISPVEAERMDPQERLFLEVAYAGIEDAGYTPANLCDSRKIGVFVGVMNGYYPKGASYWSIANRISYLFNFQGPSMAVDTACSSSLTAIHLALESLYSGMSECAVAGGVNLIVDPVHYINLTSMSMLSSGDQCKSFGELADGFVDGEGVGAIVLKPLTKAIADGDHIYGIIKGSMLNAGGKTNGYTVPNPNAQFQLISDALQRASIPARTISYLEAHGTGTVLGDPIEIAGLTRAFEQGTKDKQFCSIGSVKSNIGHSESAAGIAGLTKVLLQLKYRKLTPSINSKVLNPNIDFSNTPFVVQQELAEWKQPIIEINGKTKKYPRIAGISSFGAGGANAHIIIEEYIPEGQQQPPITITPQKPVIIPLSAKNEERLREQAQKLLSAVLEQQFPEASLAEIAYTLQVGREAMEERLAVIVPSVKELGEKLKGYIEGSEGIEDLYRGQVKRHKETLAALATDDDMPRIIDAWISKRKYAKLADLWVKGLNIDWNKLYGNTKPHRISLPTYPFARERYWMPESDAKYVRSSSALTSAIAAPIHPLLHQNTSDFSEQRFSSTFTGKEFFLSDHVVKGQRILPGVAYLEMARAAVEKATGDLAEGRDGIRFKNVVWARPIAVREQPVQVHIGLCPEENGEIVYEIYNEESEPVMHSQGRAVLSSFAEVPTLDLPSLQEKCSQSTLSSTRCYDVFRSMGIDYGPAHQGIEKVYVGKGQVLAKLSLPSSVSGTQEQFVLHPSMMDSALQASIGLMMVSSDTTQSGSLAPFELALPFALQELVIFGSCKSSMWTLISYSEGSAAEEKVQKFDIDLCDDQGRVCMRMRGFSARVLEGEIQAGKITNAVPFESPDEPLMETIMLAPVWNSIPVEKRQKSSSSTDRLVIIGGTRDIRRTIQQHYPKAQTLEIQSHDTIDEIAEKLKAHGFIDHILWVAPHKPIASLADEALIEGQDQGVIQVFRLIKALLRSGYETRDLSWSVITIQAQPIHKNDPVNPTHASLHGLIGSMAKEYPNWKTRLIDLEADCNWPVDDIFTLPADSQGNVWAYRGQEWYRQELIPFHSPQLNQTLYKSGGVYVVIGGAGGIGEVWSEYMIRTYKAQIIWIGRREKDETIRTKLDRLASLGPVPHYIVADATEQKALQQAFEEIKEHFSKINGVIHAAIVLLDRGLANMEEERFRAGLAAKVDVSVRIAQVFGNEPLDFVLFFNSVQSFAKYSGQSNYASGCTFKDAFARQLSREWPCAVKVINWGYWGSVGIVATKAYQERMAQIGIGSIEPPEAMGVLETLLASSLAQIAFIKTAKPQVVLEMFNSEELIEIYPENITSHNQNIQSHIKEQGSQVQRIKSETEPHMKEIDSLLGRLLWGQLQAMGLFTEKNMMITDLKNRAGLHDLYNRWFDESIAVLARNNYISYDGETCSVIDTTPIDIDAVWKEWDLKKGTWLEDSNTKARVVLAEATLRALPEILTGKVPATQIMFPNSSMELVEGIYKNNLVVDYFNEMLADNLVACIQERLKQDSSTRLRVIEIGAGTGGTSHTVFQKLKPYQDHIQEYCYTDISRAFLIHAEKEYGPENPYLTYKILDLGVPVAGQGIDVGGYDLAIAANVLHATKNIRQTLRNVKAVLKKNGLMLMNEISGNALFTHLTFGLLEGWWLYEDSALRIPGCPGISPEIWREVLESEGFRSVFFPAKEAHDMGQQIIIAESDGVVRQKRQLKPEVTPVKQRIGTTTVLKKQVPKQNPQKQAGRITQDLLREKSTVYITKLVGETLKIPSNKIDPSESLERYGIDSILVIKLTNSLSKVLDDISSTLFFEYQTIDALVDHLIKTQKDSLIKLTELEDHKLDEEISDDSEVCGDSEFLVEPLSSVRPTLSFRRSGRFLQCKSMEIKDSEPQHSMVQDIAIIGLSGRYPQARNIQEFWNNLRDGKDCITEIPKDRWDHSLYFDEDRNKPGKTYCRWGGFLEGVDQFDPLFFNISPREAEIMNPMDRLFLETVWDLLENSGYTRENLQRQYRARVGVYVGAMYQQYHSFDSDIINESAVSVSSYSSIANRVSYFFGLQGTSVALDTMCSSSTIAIHMACESLMRGDCQIAIAGGVNLSIHPKKYLGLSMGQMLGSHINSRSFGDGDGYLPSEGVGAILLKPLTKAIRDRDSILAVIKSTVTNHGGHTNGFTVPNPNAQAQLIEDNFKKSGIHPRTISYIEAAANGSALGDAIEVTGLNKAFKQFTTDQQFCGIGSVKSNIGHAEAASGIAQLTKVILQLQHQQLVPSIKADPLNPKINFDNTPFYLLQELREWKRPVARIDNQELEFPRRATVSSFGAGGSNAHLIIEEYIPPQEENIYNCATASPQIVVFSAKNTGRLRAVVEQLIEFLELLKEFSLPNIAYTLQVGREAMEYRVAMVVKTQDELIQGLREYLELIKGGKEIETTVPIFTGNLEEDYSRIRSILSGKLEETVVQMLLAEKNLERIALYWTQGGKIPWESLHDEKEVRRISLPTYPHARERYWIPTRKVEYPDLIQQPLANKHDFIVNTGDYSEKNVQDYILHTLSQELNIAQDQIKLYKNIQDYGVDSIVIMKLIRGFENYFHTKITGREILEFRTVQSLSTYISKQLEEVNNHAIAVSSKLETHPDNINEPIDEKVMDVLEKLSQGLLDLKDARKLL